MAADIVPSQKPPNQRSGTFRRPRYEKTYYFQDEQVNTLFHLLNKREMIKFLENQRPNEAERQMTSSTIYSIRTLGIPLKNVTILKIGFKH